MGLSVRHVSAGNPSKSLYTRPLVFAGFTGSSFMQVLFEVFLALGLLGGFVDQVSAVFSGFLDLV